MRGKRLGDFVELKFQIKAFEKGFIVSKPFGDNSQYDFIVDFNGILARIQIRSTNSKYRTGYKISTSYGGKQKQKFDKTNIDYLLAYIVPKDVWYVFPVETIKGAKTINLYPHNPNEKYCLFKDRWDFSKHVEWAKKRSCENCDHWGSITWKCVHPRGHKNNETAYPTDSCKFFNPAPGIGRKERGHGN